MMPMGSKKPGRAALILALGSKGKGEDEEEKDDTEGLDAEGQKELAQGVLDAIKADDADAMSIALKDFYSSCMD